MSGKPGGETGIENGRVWRCDTRHVGCRIGRQEREIVCGKRLAGQNDLYPVAVRCFEEVLDVGKVNSAYATVLQSITIISKVGSQEHSNVIVPGEAYVSETLCASSEL